MTERSPHSDLVQRLSTALAELHELELDELPRQGYSEKQLEDWHNDRTATLRSLEEQLEAKRRAYVLAETNLGYAEERRRELQEQLDTAQKTLRMIGECGDALVEDGYGYLVVEAIDALGSNPASDSPSLREQLEAAQREVRRWLAWSNDQYPDSSPGDVIAAELDGTITLDDGVTTWNPLRAAEFFDQRACERKEQLEAHDKLIRRFLEWDALVGLPAALPAPFGDLRYWIAEFERAASSPAWKYGDLIQATMTVSNPARSSCDHDDWKAPNPASEPKEQT